MLFRKELTLSFHGSSFQLKKLTQRNFILLENPKCMEVSVKFYAFVFLCNKNNDASHLFNNRYITEIKVE